ncbi:sugar nucleotide-binding protein, partial [Bacillus safensis]|uniref:sugar nucleotide-binding protein n=1 Tax=Bacillus safensis TaxID=561879 RepID=UPI002DD41DAF
EGRNFVTRMLDRVDDEQLDIVSDEVGSPTAAADLAQGLLRLVAVRLQTGGFGEASVLHFANDGSASRHELAQAVFD